MIGDSEPVGLHVRNLFRILLDQQEQAGLADYGRPLSLDTAIDPLEFALSELVDAFQYVTLAMLRRDSAGEDAAPLSPAIMARRAEQHLEELHREMRNGLPLDYFYGAAGAFAAVGLLDADRAELLKRRVIDTCPGHDDEGGRNWCAYGCPVNGGAE